MTMRYYDDSCDKFARETKRLLKDRPEELLGRIYEEYRLLANSLDPYYRGHYDDVDSNYSTFTREDRHRLDFQIGYALGSAIAQHMSADDIIQAVIRVLVEAGLKRR